MRSGGARQISLGKIAGIPIRVSPTWFIVAGVITIGLAPLAEQWLPDLGNLVYAVTFAFAVLLYVSVLLHEISHALTARAFGLPVRGVTLHFLGGHTEIERDSPTPGRDLIVGAFNLLPALPLDGGHMLRAVVWRLTGSEHTGTVVSARSAQVLAVAVLLAPFVIARGRPDILAIVWAALIAMLLWSGASQSLAVGRVRSRLPTLDLRQLTRRAAPVGPETPLAEALRQAHEAGMQSLVVVDSSNRPTGLVNEAAVHATPEDRRPWVPVGQLARSIEPGLVLDLDLVGERLVAALRETPASEYLVVDGDGAVYGVLTAADIDAALTAS